MSNDERVIGTKNLGINTIRIKDMIDLYCEILTEKKDIIREKQSRIWSLENYKKSHERQITDLKARVKELEGENTCKDCGGKTNRPELCDKCRIKHLRAQNGTYFQYIETREVIISSLRDDKKALEKENAELKEQESVSQEILTDYNNELQSVKKELQEMKGQLPAECEKCTQGLRRYEAVTSTTPDRTEDKCPICGDGYSDDNKKKYATSFFNDKIIDGHEACVDKKAKEILGAANE